MQMILQKPSSNKSRPIHSHSPSASSYLQTQSHSPHPHTQNQIELQINISIGKTRYLLQVKKCENLHEEVQRFLKDNNLNCKYEGMILEMVRQQLGKREGKDKYNEKEKSKILVKAVQELKKVKDQMEGKRRIEERQKKNQRCLKQQTSVEMDLSNKQNKSVNIESKQNNQTTDQNSCKNVYQKWKIKQKQKQRQLVKTPKHSKNVSNVSKSTIMNQKQKSQRKTTDKNKDQSSEKLDHFYTKGIKFNYAKQQNRQNLFKKQYPFQPQNNREVSLTPRKKNELHERLFKESKVKQVIKIQKRITEEQNNNKSISKYCNMDKYKKRVIERDGKVNQALNYLIQNKMIENPYRIQSVGKSPFRKTNCY